MNQSTKRPIRADSTLVLTLARRHLDKDKTANARSCMAEAICAQDMGNLEQALRRALRSLAYSVGILHSDYVRAFKASGIEGGIRLVS